MDIVNTDFSNSFYEKLFLLNNLSIKTKSQNRIYLPSDIIEKEIKPFCFDDKMTGISKKVKNKTNEIIKRAKSNNQYRRFGYLDIYNNSDKLRLRATNCYICGNYRYYSFPIMTYEPRQFRYTICMCVQHGW